MKICVLTTGGTLGGHSANSSANPDIQVLLNDALGGLYKNSSASQLNVDTKEVLDMDSTYLGPLEWKKIIGMVVNEYDNYDGFVITHGTNTLAFSAAALAFAFPALDKPVVFTGAQISLGMPGSDAMVNLQNAVRVASSTNPSFMGVVVVFGSYIVAGVRARKNSIFALDAFPAAGEGCLGRIGIDIKIDRHNLANHHANLDLNRNRSLKSKDLLVHSDFNVENILSINEFPGMRSNWWVENTLRKIDVLKGNHGKDESPDGVILSSFGAGDSACRDFLEELKTRRIPVVLTSQTSSGKVTMMENKPGEGLIHDGLAVPSYDMSLECLTVKFGWLLAHKLSYEEMKIQLTRNIRGEIEAPLFDTERNEGLPELKAV